MTTGSPKDLPQPADPHIALAQAEAALADSRAREAALRRELEHRVRNALAITRSVFARTMDTATSVEQARDHLSGRLDAMARYHGRLASLPGYTFDLETMIWDELMVYASGADPRIAVTGPDVPIELGIAGPLGLALHELATNSVKFGVLGQPATTGRLRIEWSRGDGDVQLRWIESGVPIVIPAPPAIGFGRGLIVDGLPYQLGAETSFDFVPGGLECEILFDPGHLRRWTRTQPDALTDDDDALGDNSTPQ